MKELSSHPNIVLMYGVVSHFNEDGVAMSMVLESNGRGVLKFILDACRARAPTQQSLIYDTADSAVRTPVHIRALGAVYVATYG